MKIVARHKKTGTHYIFAEISVRAPKLCVVKTKRNKQPWLVHTEDVEFLTNHHEKHNRLH